MATGLARLTTGTDMSELQILEGLRSMYKRFYILPSELSRLYTGDGVVFGLDCVDEVIPLKQKILRTVCCEHLPSPLASLKTPG